MPFGGQYSARSPGEARVFSFDFFNDLAPGDSIDPKNTTTTLTVYQGADPNAATLLIGSPTILSGLGTNTVVAQKIGTNVNNATGFLPGVVYRWTITAQTALGETAVWDEWIPVVEIV